MSSSAKSSSKDEEASSGEDSSGDEAPMGDAVAASPKTTERRSTLEQLKREKRLSMNRESARARRRRKKLRLETLEKRAEDLGQRHHNLVLTNQSLKSRVTHLESELATFGGASRGFVRVGMGGMDPAGILSGAASSGFGGGMGFPGMRGVADPDMQYLQMQQQLLSTQAGAGGEGASRLMALEDMQRRNQLAAFRGGVPLGGAADRDRLNQQLPAFRQLNEISRIRGAEGLRGPAAMDLGMSPADAAARIRGQSGASHGGVKQPDTRKKPSPP